MRDSELTIIEYDFTADDHWRERVVSIGPCPGKAPELSGPNKWKHERIACDSGDGTECDVRVLCTCGWVGTPHETESAAIEAFNTSLGLETKPLTEWLIHNRQPVGTAAELPF